MPALSIAAAHFIGFFLGAIVFGMHTITFARCQRTLTMTRRGWRKRCDIRWLMVAISLVLYVNAMFDIVLEFYQVLTVLVVDRRTDSFPEGKFTDIGWWINVAKVKWSLCQNIIRSALCSLEFVILVIFRAFSVSNRGCTTGTQCRFAMVFFDLDAHSIPQSKSYTAAGLSTTEIG